MPDRMPWMAAYAHRFNPDPTARRDPVTGDRPCCCGRGRGSALHPEGGTDA